MFCRYYNTRTKILLVRKALSSNRDTKFVFPEWLILPVFLVFSITRSEHHWKFEYTLKVSERMQWNFVELRSFVKEVWCSIPNDYIWTFYKPIPRRLNAVLKNHGRYSKYWRIGIIYLTSIFFMYSWYFWRYTNKVHKYFTLLSLIINKSSQVINKLICNKDLKSMFYKKLIIFIYIIFDIYFVICRYSKMENEVITEVKEKRKHVSDLQWKCFKLWRICT